ncbi:MAG: branched-chain amino acid ABC transporter permease, partial [Acidimicrobiia bacterium]|nr:branched-chain amino acid ABC transporter permease [Acidimicrobiia bacterium]
MRRIILIALSVAIIYGVVAGSTATLRTGTFSAEVWQSLFINGLARGSVYALIAIGYTLVYGILFMINFAHGEVFMAGVYTAYFVAVAFAGSGFLNSNPLIAIFILLLVSMAVSVFIAVILERLAYRPLRGAPRLVPLITAIGASFFLQYTFRGLYGANVRAYPEIEILRGKWTIFGIQMLKTQAIVIVAALLLWILLYLFVARTKTGRSMRAVGEDR